MIDPEIGGARGPVADDRTLRAFAVLCCGLLAAMTGWDLLRGAAGTRTWLALAALLFCGSAAIARPALIRPVFVGLLALTRPVGAVMSLLVLGIVYYLFVTPLAFVFRASGRDLLRRRRPDTASYWEPKRQPSDPRRYLSPYQRQ